jgi:hypothetical protein
VCNAFQASSFERVVEASKIAGHTQKIFAEDVCQVIKIASLLLSGAMERTVQSERIILLEQFVTEAAEVWNVPNSRLFALPYSLSRTCRLVLTVLRCCQQLSFIRILITHHQGKSEDASFEADDAS